VRGHVRRGKLDELSGWEILHTFRWLGVTRHGTFSMLDRVWERRDNLTAYDATYVASPRRCSAPRYGRWPDQSGARHALPGNGIAG
jgi:predicted nucleic acid-binding protein